MEWIHHRKAIDGILRPKQNWYRNKCTHIVHTSKLCECVGQIRDLKSYFGTISKRIKRIKILFCPLSFYFIQKKMSCFIFHSNRSYIKYGKHYKNGNCLS